MNKKVKTITTWLAATIFLLALAINIKVTLDDPFVMLSDEAIAQTTTDDESGTSTGTDNGFYKIKEIRLRSVSEVKSWDAGATINGSIPFVGQLVNKVLDTVSGTIYYKGEKAIDQYTILCPSTTIMQTVECISQSWTNCPTSGCPESDI